MVLGGDAQLLCGWNSTQNSLAVPVLVDPRSIELPTTMVNKCAQQVFTRGIGRERVVPRRFFGLAKCDGTQDHRRRTRSRDRVRHGARVLHRAQRSRSASVEKVETQLRPLASAGTGVDNELVLSRHEYRFHNQTRQESAATWTRCRLVRLYKTDESKVTLRSIVRSRRRIEPIQTQVKRSSCRNDARCGPCSATADLRGYSKGHAPRGRSH